MSHKLLAPYRPGRQCEIGPFVVDYVFKRHGLIVELEPRDRTAASRSGARTAFLNEMGYSVLSVARRELHSRPQRVLAQIVAALRR